MGIDCKVPLKRNTNLLDDDNEGDHDPPVDNTESAGHELNKDLNLLQDCEKDLQTPHDRGCVHLDKIKG